MSTYLLYNIYDKNPFIHGLCSVYARDRQTLDLQAIQRNSYPTNSSALKIRADFDCHDALASSCLPHLALAI